MPSFRLVLAYDGTEFVGWQRQAEGVSIQGLIEAAAAELDGAPVTVTGAGRTDAGVHAVGQVASFTLMRALSPAAVLGAMNARLPGAIRVLDVSEVPSEFSARFDARWKHYRYRIWNGPVIPPHERLYVWHVAGPLDLDAMREAAPVIVGHHDFAAFRAVGSDVRSTERTITLSTVEETAPGWGAPVAVPGRLVTYDVRGDGFLRHMVRAIVGSLVEIGHGRRPPGWLADVLASRDRATAGPTAPAHGLFLVRVAYEDTLAAGR